MSDQILLTPEGLQKIKDELHTLKSVRRKEVASRIEAALKLGDLSENAEYHEAKEQSGWVEGRIMDLQAMISRGTVVERTSNGRVDIGSSVTVDGNNKKKTFVIVGDNESDPGNGRISAHSPIGNALFGKSLNDRVEVITPAGKTAYTIIEIH